MAQLNLRAFDQPEQSFVGAEELFKQYEEKRDVIKARLAHFREVGKRPDAEIFAELCFCILTPQSKARSCDAVIQRLICNGLLYVGTPDDILPFLSDVRFPENKSRWLVEARERFYRDDGAWTLKDTLSRFDDDFRAREWLASEVKGLGFKEASHFLRNIGGGYDLAILDRHILKNLHRHGVIESVPHSLTKREYLRIERLMRNFSLSIGVPMAELDLLFWSRETGEIFK